MINIFPTKKKRFLISLDKKILEKSETFKLIFYNVIFNFRMIYLHLKKKILQLSIDVHIP